jgi:hypothetical protein
MSTNEPLEHEPTAEELHPGFDKIHVEGNALVLPSHVMLPPICVKTNRPLSESEMIEAKLYWCPRSAIAWGIISGGLIYIIAYFAMREEFIITYGLDRSIRKKRMLWTIPKLLIAIGSLPAAIAIAVSNSTHWIIMPLVFALFGLFAAALASLFLGGSPLNVVDRKDEMFWVKGFSKEFLDGLNIGSE